MLTNSAFQDALSTIEPLIREKQKLPRKFSLSVKKRFNHSSLIDLYVNSFPHVDREFWIKKIESGNLKLDNKIATPDQKVKAGQITSHWVDPKPEPQVNWNIELVHASKDYWVINKPSPLPVHAGGRYLHHSLTNVLKLAFPERNFHLINRLDANTTGIVLVALNKDIANTLANQFKHRDVKKTYLALIEGFPIQSEFKSTQSISKTKTPAGGRTLDGGNNSLTTFKVLKTFFQHTLLEVTPHSGHTNQIRLHLAGLRLPIVGDLGYKNPEYFESNPLTYSKDQLFLHAWKLEFTDPISYERKLFTAPPNAKWTPFIP